MRGSDGPVNRHAFVLCAKFDANVSLIVSWLTPHLVVITDAQWDKLVNAACGRSKLLGLAYPAMHRDGVDSMLQGYPGNRRRRHLRLPDNTGFELRWVIPPLRCYRAFVNVRAYDFHSAHDASSAITTQDDLAARLLPSAMPSAK
jgi:hypothetical protein